MPNDPIQNDKAWTAAQIPDQAGRVVVITGSNSGIGYAAARELAGKNAQVLLAVRNMDKGRAAQDAILTTYPQAQVHVAQLDLARQQSIHDFAQQFEANYGRLDLLINNGGVMATPYVCTEDGFELQFATNHLGHFALTGLLLPHLTNTPRARIVTVSSAVHKGTQLDFDNLDASRGYHRWRAYRASKLANLYFAYELQRRLEAAASNVCSVACHPGYTATQLQRGGMMMDGGRVHEWIITAMNKLFAQDATLGALPTLYAAVASAIQGGEYIGPGGLFGTRGYPVETRSSPASYDEEAARRLWAYSETMTGVEYALLAPTRHPAASELSKAKSV